MFDWFNRHKWLGLVLMSILLVTMGVSFAMIEVLSAAVSGEDDSSVAFVACGRSFSRGEVAEQRAIVELCSRMLGAPPAVSLDGSTGGIAEREAAVRLILLELAAKNGISTTKAEVEEQISRLLDQNKQGVEANLRYAHRTMADVRQYFKDEITIYRLMGYELDTVVATTSEVYEDLAKNESGGSQYAWVDLSFAAARAKVVTELEDEMASFYDEYKSLFRSTYEVGGEWILARVKSDFDDEAVAAAHAASQDASIMGKPLEDVRGLVLAALATQARDRADAAIQAVAAVLQEEGMATAALAQVMEQVTERTENGYDDILEVGTTGDDGLVDAAELPETLRMCNFAGQARTVAAEGGVLSKLIGRNGNTGEIAFYASVRVLGRKDSRQLTLEEVAADGYGKLLEVFYDVNPLRFTPKEVRVADIAIVDFETFAKEGEVVDDAVEEFYTTNVVQLFTRDGEIVTLEDAREEIIPILRRRDAVEVARENLTALDKRLDSLGRDLDLLEIAAGSLVQVHRVPITTGDINLDQCPGLDFISRDQRARIYYAVNGITPADIDAGKISAIVDLPTRSLLAKVVERRTSDKSPLDESLRSRLLDEFIRARAFVRFSDEASSLRERMAVMQPGTEDPEKWDDAQREQWQHDNRTRFARVAEDEKLEIQTSEGFYTENDTEFGVLDEIPGFARTRSRLGLDYVELMPAMPGTDYDPSFRDTYRLVTTWKTIGLAPDSITGDQLDSGRRTLMGKRQKELRDDLVRLSKLRERPDVAFEPRSESMLAIDYKEEDKE